MVYVATSRPVFLVGGISLGAGAVMLGYALFKIRCSSMLWCESMHGKIRLQISTEAVISCPSRFSQSERADMQVLD